MIKTGVRLDLQESKELPRGEKMATRAGGDGFLHQVHFTSATRVLQPMTSSTLPDWNQNKATFEFTTAHLSLLASLKPSHTSAKPLKGLSGPEHRLALPLLAEPT